jgi:hypothetical protein
MYIVIRRVIRIAKFTGALQLQLCCQTSMRELTIPIWFDCSLKANQ